MRKEHFLSIPLVGIAVPILQMRKLSQERCSELLKVTQGYMEELTFRLTSVFLNNGLLQGLGAAEIEAAGAEPQVWGPN